MYHPRISNVKTSSSKNNNKKNNLRIVLTSSTSLAVKVPPYFLIPNQYLLLWVNEMDLTAVLVQWLNLDLNLYIHSYSAFSVQFDCPYMVFTKCAYIVLVCLHSSIWHCFRLIVDSLTTLPIQSIHFKISFVLWIVTVSQPHRERILCQMNNL